MNVFRSLTNIEQWRYTIRQLGVKIPNVPMKDIPAIRVQSMSIEEQFETYMFPLFKLTLKLEKDLYYMILQNKKDCQIYLRIDKFYYLNENENKSIYKSFINDMFDIIIDDDNEDFSIIDNLKKNTSYERTKDDILNSLDTEYYDLELYLFNSAVKNTKVNVNKILDKSDVLDGILYLMSEAKINNLIMSQPDNRDVYDNLIIPHMTITKALMFLDNYYGIYKTGTLIWFGLNNTYIIPYNGKCSAYKKNEKKITTIVVNHSSNTGHRLTSGRIHDEKQNFIVTNNNLLQNIEDNSISNDYIHGNKLQTVDSYEGETTENNEKDNFTKIYENMTMNKYISNIYEAQTKALGTIINIGLNNIDLDDLTPNKQFKFLFEYTGYSKKYGGEYILSSISSSFIRDGSDFYINTNAVFKKAK